MNITSWDYYYKINKNGERLESNLLYTPYINPKKTIMCMHYAQNLDYQPYKIIPNDTLEFFFNREVRFLHELKDFNFTPKIYDINKKEKKIYIEFPGETLSQIVFDPNRSLDEECPDWKEQLYNIMKSLKDNKYYKVALYPHCFFITDNLKIKTIDYYSVIPFNNSLIHRSIIEPIIGKMGEYRFNRSTKDGFVDFKNFFFITMNEHLGNYWIDNPFPSFYKKLFEENF